MHDATERQSAMEKFQTIFELSTVGLSLQIHINQIVQCCRYIECGNTASAIRTSAFWALLLIAASTSLVLLHVRNLVRRSAEAVEACLSS